MTGEAWTIGTALTTGTLTEWLTTELWDTATGAAWTAWTIGAAWTAWTTGAAWTEWTTGAAWTTGATLTIGDPWWMTELL